ncbi:hypothetical protein GY45DRAFT_1083428 [Cubamyces sp. BRFM 1775]|nr:hypothetical protein GY45DRAFT_1083428 [Cubamyces sp. BRFM 1775]
MPATFEGGHLAATYRRAIMTKSSRCCDLWEGSSDGLSPSRTLLTMTTHRCNAIRPPFSAGMPRLGMPCTARSPFKIYPHHRTREGLPSSKRSSLTFLAHMVQSDRPARPQWRSGQTPLDSPLLDTPYPRSTQSAIGIEPCSPGLRAPCCG